MKTKKDFPATHSMSTEWFIADAEGNIALFSFDENGPVPVAAPSEGGADLMTSDEDFGETDSDSIGYLELTDEQVNELMSDAVIPDVNYEFDFNLFVQIDKAKKDEFLKVFDDKVDFCLSHKHGIYFLSTLYWFEAESNFLV